MAKDSFIFHLENAEDLEELTMEQQGMIFAALIKYTQTGEEPCFDDPLLRASWRPIFRRLKSDVEYYAEKCERNAANGAKGGAPKGNQNARKTTENNPKQPKTTENNPKQPKTTLSDSDTDSDIDSDTDTDTDTEERNNDTLLKIPHMVGEPTDFERFWHEYPKKVGKQDAKKAFTRAKKSVDAGTMIRAVIAQRDSLQWTRDNGRYIPNPATWLNQGRWDDEIQTKGNTSFGIDWDNV